MKVDPRPALAVQRAVDAVRRIAPGPAALRFTACLLAAVAATVALPTVLRATPWTYVIVAGMAIMPVLRPDTAWVTAVEVAIVVEWLLSTMVYAEPRGILALLAVTALLYAHHTTCALAAAVPITADLAPGVLLNWLIRTASILVVSIALGLVALLALPKHLASAAILPLLGLFAAIAAGAVIAYQLHRRR